MPSKKSPASSDTRYLQRIGSRWYARIPVPNKLREELGPYIRKSLDTSDIHEARQRRWDVLEMARKTIAKHEAKGKPVGISKEELSYAAFRAKLKDMGPHVIEDRYGDEMYNPLIDDLIDDVREGRVPEDSNLANALSDHVTGREPVSETLRSYLEANPKRNPTTAKNHETTVKLWVAKHKDRPIYGVTRRQALDWLEGVAEGKARDTVKRYATVMGHLWTWAHRKKIHLRTPSRIYSSASDRRGGRLKVMGSTTRKNSNRLTLLSRMMMSYALSSLSRSIPASAWTSA